MGLLTKSASDSQVKCAGVRVPYNLFEELKAKTAEIAGIKVKELSAVGPQDLIMNLILNLLGKTSETDVADWYEQIKYSKKSE